MIETPTRAAAASRPGGRAAWVEALGSRLVMGGCFALATVLTAVSVTLGSSPNLSGALGPASPWC